MKEAQEKLTGDAFKRGHTGDELWGGRNRHQAARATLPPPEPELRSAPSQPRLTDRPTNQPTNHHLHPHFRQWGPSHWQISSQPEGEASVLECVCSSCAVFFHHFSFPRWRLCFKTCIFVKSTVIYLPCAVVTVCRGHNRLKLAKLTIINTHLFLSDGKNAKFFFNDFALCVSREPLSWAFFFGFRSFTITL